MRRVAAELGRVAPTGPVLTRDGARPARSSLLARQRAWLKEAGKDSVGELKAAASIRGPQITFNVTEVVHQLVEVDRLSVNAGCLPRAAFLARRED